VVLCRVARSVGPLDHVAEQLEFLVKAREFVSWLKVPAGG
jgi:hypothetical protein